MKTKSFILLMLIAGTHDHQRAERRRKRSAENKKPLVQIAILLDTSNSMDGLIEQAKGQLWKICNEFIKAQAGRRRPGSAGRALSIRQQ